MGGRRKQSQRQREGPALDNMTDFFKGAAAEMPATLNPGEYRVFTGK